MDAWTLNPLDPTQSAWLHEAMPQEFPFYHLGRVERRASETLNLPEDPAAAVFSLRGDLTGMMIVAFDRDLDPSTYAEMGNILASQLVTRLYSQRRMEVMITSPRMMMGGELRTLLARIPSSAPKVQQCYWHNHAGKTERVHAILTLQTGEGGFHA